MKAISRAKALFLVPIFGAISGAISIYTFYSIAAIFMLIGFGMVYFSKLNLQS